MQLNVFDNAFTWIVLAFIGVTSLKFLPHFFWHRAFRSSRVPVSKPLRGGPSLVNWQPDAESQSQDEINAERLVAYRMSGGGLMVLCWVGGIALLALGLIQMPGFKLELGDNTLQNVTPGIVSLVLGVIIWRQIRK